MVKNILLLLFVSICLSAAAQTPKFKVITTDFSKGNNPGKEYIELLVLGEKTCSEALGGDSIAHLGNYVIYDKNGDSVYYINTDTFPGIASGHYRFPNTPTWDSVPYGSLIIIYNNKEKNNRLTLSPNLSGAGGTYVVPVDSLLRYNSDTLSIALPDSIIPTPQPPFFTLGEDSNAYIKNPTSVNPLPTQNDPANWGIELSGKTSLNETPGFFTSDALNQWRNQVATPAVYPIKIGLKVAPPISVTFQGVTDTIYYCSSTFKFVGSTSLPANSTKFEWRINGIGDTTITSNNDTIPNNSDSLIKIIHQNNKVVFKVSTRLKCISGPDSVFASYNAFNVYPDGDTLKVAIGVAINGDTTQKAKVDSFRTDSIGRIDSTVSYKYICKGSVATYYPLPNHSGTSDLYTWVKNGITVAKDSLYTDSSVGSSGRSIDTIFCILNSSLNCVDKPSDTTTMIIHVLDYIPIPTITVKADTSVCSNATDSFFASFNYSSAKRDTTSRYNIVWMVNRRGIISIGRDQTYV